MPSKTRSKTPSKSRSKTPSRSRSKTPSESKSKSPSKEVKSMFHTIMTKINIPNPKPFPNSDIENVMKNMKNNGKFDRLVTKLKQIKKQSENQKDKYMKNIEAFIIKETRSDKTVGGRDRERYNPYDRNMWQYKVAEGFEEEYGPANLYALSVIIVGAAAIIFYNPLATPITLTGVILGIRQLRRRGGQGSSTKTRRRR